MTKYREIIRLSSMGLSQRSIASSCRCSRNTVSDVLSRAAGKELTWPLPEDIADADLQLLLFPEKAQRDEQSRKVPDCEYIHRELAKSGVTLSLCEAKILVPDNLKTGVQKSSWHSPVINKTYHEMAEHFSVTFIELDE